MSEGLGPKVLGPGCVSTPETRCALITMITRSRNLLWHKQRITRQVNQVSARDLAWQIPQVAMYVINLERSGLFNHMKARLRLVVIIRGDYLGAPFAAFCSINPSLAPISNTLIPLIFSGRPSLNHTPSGLQAPGVQIPGAI